MPPTTYSVKMRIKYWIRKNIQRYQELENESDEAEIQNYINRIPLLRKKLHFFLHFTTVFHHQNSGFTDDILPFISMKRYAI